MLPTNSEPMAALAKSLAALSLRLLVRRRACLRAGEGSFILRRRLALRCHHLLKLLTLPE